MSKLVKPGCGILPPAKMPVTHPPARARVAQSNEMC